MLISAKLEKFASNLMTNTTKIRKTLKSEKCITILAKIWTKEWKLSFFKCECFSNFCNIYLQAEVNFPGPQPKSAYFFNFIFIFGFMRQINTSFSAISREFDKQNQKKYSDFSRKSGKLAIQIKDNYYKFGKCSTQKKF